MPMVYGVALKYLKRSGDAREAVMRLFEDLAERVVEYPVGGFKSWLYACVREYCLSELQKRSSDLPVELDGSVMEFCDGSNFEEIRGEATQGKVFQKCVEILPEKQRICIYRFFMEERSYREIEDATGFTSEQVRGLIRNGKRSLELFLGKKEIV